MEYQVIDIPAPAAPASGATITLFDSTVNFRPGVLGMMGAGRLSVNFAQLSHVSATGGLKAYTSTNKGVNWDPTAMSVSGASATLPATVAATTSDNAVYDIAIKNERDFKLTYTNSANTLTAWRVSMKITFGDVHVVTP